MDNNRTYVPGMDSGATSGFNPYSSVTPGSGTVVPGMQAEAPVEAQPEAKAPAGTPVVGFLYSISNGGTTEYWPIHIGSNIIGRGEGVDISLNEATVSSRHAQINVKRLRQSQKLIANIQDIGSKCGMFLNDEELDYETHSCKNGDVITIGEAYKLLLVLVDTDAVGLSIAENFRAVKVTEPQAEEPVMPKFSQGEGINPYDRNNGTVDLSGINPIGGPGGTMILE